jgi:hypothetical protein
LLRYRRHEINIARQTVSRYPDDALASAETQLAAEAKMKLLRMLAWLLLTQTAAFGADEMALRGVGTSTCGEFANLYAKDPHSVETIFFAWAQGYWSSENANLLSKGQYRELAGSSDVQRSAIRAYCNQHPLATYWQATVAVFYSFPLTESRR